MAISVVEQGQAWHTALVDATFGGICFDAMLLQLHDATLFLETSFRTLLRREIDADSLINFTVDFASSCLTKADFLLIISQSEEYQNLLDRFSAPYLINAQVFFSNPHILDKIPSGSQHGMALLKRAYRNILFQPAHERAGAGHSFKKYVLGKAILFSDEDDTFDKQCYVYRKAQEMILPDKEVIFAFYLLFFDRFPSPNEIDHHIDLIASGISIDGLLTAFMSSEEAKKINDKNTTFCIAV